jgi:hypothetical protein
MGLVLIGLDGIGFWLCLFDTKDIVSPISENIGWDGLGFDSLGNINPRLVSWMPWVTYTLG